MFFENFFQSLYSNTTLESHQYAFILTVLAYFCLKITNLIQLSKSTLQRALITKSKKFLTLALVPEELIYRVYRIRLSVMISTSAP